MDSITDLIPVENINPLNVAIGVLVVGYILYLNRTNIYKFLKSYFAGEDVINRKNNESVNNDEDSEVTKYTLDDLSFIIDKHGSDIGTIKTDIGKIVTSIESMEKTNEERRDDRKDIQEKLSSIDNTLLNMDTDIKNRINDVVKKCDFLMECDMNDKKAYIVEKYYYFAIKRKKIDYNSLDTLNQIYENYLKENGNTYISTLMSKIRNLDIVTREDMEEEDEK